MKIEQFKKYKKIVESRSPEVLQAFPEAAKVHNWMENSGRLDEGFFGAIWSWLKRNFSPTAIQLHKLADELGSELSKEMKAEFDRKEDYKNKAAQMRSSWAGKMSGDIQERMWIIAEKDEDYDDLVRYLINKETLKAKKANLQYLDDDDAKVIEDELNKAEKANEKKGDSAYKNLTRDERDKVDEIRKFLKDEVKKYSKVFDILNDEDKKSFVESFANYTFKISKKYGKAYNVKTIGTYLSDIAKFVENDTRQLSINGISYEDAAKELLKALEYFMDKDAELDIPRLKSSALSRAKQRLGKDDDRNDDKDDEDIDVEKEVTTPVTGDILDKDEVDNAITSASKNTGKKNPSSNDIVNEITEHIEKYFEDNLGRFINAINKRVDEFNKKTDSERKSAMGKYEYNLESDNTLKKVSSDDVKVLIKDYITIAGAIVPYYQKKVDTAEIASKTALRLMFEIYAVKKNASGNLDKADIAIIVDDIKTKYPDDYK
jgi:hypothetical protein